MSLIVEIIDGVAYVAEKIDNKLFPCDVCVFNKTDKCYDTCVCGRDKNDYHYRRLTDKEREELIKAIGRGME